MNIEIEWDCYNGRRFGKPWIAKITEWTEARPVLKWGEYMGDAEGGTLEIAADVGDIIRHGQKDNRSNGTVNRWSILDADGSLREVTQAEARKHWKSQGSVSNLSEPDKTIGRIDNLLAFAAKNADGDFDTIVADLMAACAVTYSSLSLSEEAFVRYARTIYAGERERLTIVGETG